MLSGLLFDESPDSKWLNVNGDYFSLRDQKHVDLLSLDGVQTFPPFRTWVTLNNESLGGGPLGTFVNPASGKLHRFVCQEHPFRDITISPDGRNLAVVSDVAPQLRVFAIDDKEEPPRLWPVLELETNPGYQCVFTPDNRTLLTIDSNGVVDYIHADSLR